MIRSRTMAGIQNLQNGIRSCHARAIILVTLRIGSIHCQGRLLKKGSQMFGDGLTYWTDVCTWHDYNSVVTFRADPLLTNLEHRILHSRTLITAVVTAFAWNTL
jgi:hypothetical protein